MDRHSTVINHVLINVKDCLHTDDTCEHIIIQESLNQYVHLYTPLH